MQKAALRKLYKDKRKELGASAMMKYQDLILIRFQQLKLEIPDNIMSYSSSEKLREYDPITVVDYCYFKNPALRLCYPVMKENVGMNAVQVREDTAFTENDFGIEEPVDGSIIPPAVIDMVFVPILAFDEKGNRVGYGKGYYDRFLAECRPDCLKIGFSFFDAELHIDAEPTDIALDYCITPNKEYSFNRKS